MSKAEELAKRLESNGEGCRCHAYSASECACDAVWGESYTGDAAALLRSQEVVIKQMHESMCWASRVLQIDVDDAPGYFAAITAAKEVLK